MPIKVVQGKRYGKDSEFCIGVSRGEACAQRCRIWGQGLRFKVSPQD